MKKILTISISYFTLAFVWFGVSMATPAFAGGQLEKSNRKTDR